MINAIYNGENRNEELLKNFPRLTSYRRRESKFKPVDT